MEVAYADADATADAEEPNLVVELDDGTRTTRHWDSFCNLWRWTVAPSSSKSSLLSRESEKLQWGAWSPPAPEASVPEVEDGGVGSEADLYADLLAKILPIHCLQDVDYADLLEQSRARFDLGCADATRM